MTEHPATESVTTEPETTTTTEPTTVADNSEMELGSRGWRSLLYLNLRLRLSWSAVHW